MKTLRFICLLVTICLLAGSACADPVKDCASVLGDLGPPTGPKGLVPFCSPNVMYFTLQDTKALIPRVVVERLDGQKVVTGCVARTNNFHPEKTMPTAKNFDYDKSGYDQGHQMPAEDADWSKSGMPDTFSFANMAPQLPGLNRQGWKGMEEWIRAAALSVGDVMVIYTGPILGGTKTIGADGVVVPTAFYKIIYDEKTGKAWAFIYPQADVPENAPVAKYQDAVGEVEKETGVAFPFSGDRSFVLALPQADKSAWRATHTKSCK